jgi:hypothetical protein
MSLAHAMDPAEQTLLANMCSIIVLASSFLAVLTFRDEHEKAIIYAPCWNAIGRHACAAVVAFVAWFTNGKVVKDRV